MKLPKPLLEGKMEKRNVMNADFMEWWQRDGKFYDPDTEDVDWFDKRVELAEYTFTRARLEADRQLEECAAALMKLWKHTAKMDNGYCAVCRCAARSHGKPCENERCLSRVIEAALSKLQAGIGGQQVSAEVDRP